MIIRDNYMERIKAYKDTPLIKVVTGIRRCGKSTLLLLYKEYLLGIGVSEDHIININFELMEYDEIRDYKVLYKLIKNRMPQN